MKVSCIIPTSSRPHFLENAIKLFLDQDYLDSELIIVYNSWADLPANVVSDKRICLIRTEATSIGEKRNVACAAATGKIIAFFDDDDWYSQDRISKQVEPILAGRASITGLTNTPFFDVLSWRVSVLTAAEHKKRFSFDVAGGTLVFLKSLWVKNKFDKISLREDANFLEASVRSGAKLEAIDASGLFLYIRHQGNTWRTFGGTAILEQPPDAKKLGFYHSIREDYLCRSPRVSCIMPTFGRQKYIIGAVNLFLSQTHANKELVIVDDGEPIAGLLPKHPSIIYKRASGKSTIGAKRNMCCQLATGDIIVHMDDDDWYGPNWISKCIESLSGSDICGVQDPAFFCEDSETAYVYRNDYPNWVAGATLAYRKSLWDGRKFADVQIGEDNEFIRGLVPSIMDNSGFIARIHKRNTSRKKVDSDRYSVVETPTEASYFKEGPAYRP